jgi:hypothetical protein
MGRAIKNAQSPEASDLNGRAPTPRSAGYERRAFRAIMKSGEPCGPPISSLCVWLRSVHLEQVFKHLTEEGGRFAFDVDILFSLQVQLLRIRFRGPLDDYPELKIRSPGMIGPTRVGKISVLGVSREVPRAPAVLSARSGLNRARHLNRRPRSMNDAASAALPPQLQTPTRRECPTASTAVNPVDVMRSHR